NVCRVFPEMRVMLQRVDMVKRCVHSQNQQLSCIGTAIILGYELVFYLLPKAPTAQTLLSHLLQVAGFAQTIFGITSQCLQRFGLAAFSTQTRLKKSVLPSLPI